MTFSNAGGAIKGRDTGKAILKCEITAIRDREEKMLKLVSNRFAVKASLLPSPDEIRDFLVENGIHPDKAQLIVKGYDIKIEMLREFQEGKTISLYHEKHPQ